MTLLRGARAAAEHAARRGHHRHANGLTGRPPGKAVQVDPIEFTLKASGTKRLKPQYYTLLSNFAVKFNLRRYTVVFDLERVKVGSG
jgi:hypothetical protein